MNNDKANQLAAEVSELFTKGMVGPFPYSDCRRLLREDPDKYEYLIPTLDLFFSTVAGYASWGLKSLQWGSEQIDKATKDLKASFFEQYPLYEPLLPLVTFSNTPHLYSDLRAHEGVRQKLLELLELLNE